MNELIYKQVAIDTVDFIIDRDKSGNNDVVNALTAWKEYIKALPSVEPTLYGYKIEHLAYIARVMQKEGITAEQAVNAFDDLGMAVRLITEEAQQKIEEAIYDYNTGKI